MSKRNLMKALSFVFAIIMVLSAAIMPMTGIIASAANDTFEDAKIIEFAQQYTGSITSTDTHDYYKIVLDEAGMLKVDILAFCDAYYELYGQNKEGILTYRNISISFTSGFKNEVVNIYLTAGTYYFCMHRWDMNGEYNITFDFESSNETIKEAYGGSNETMNTASEILLNQKYYGVIAKNETYDFYKFTLDEKTKVKIKFHTDDASWVQFYNSKGTELYGNSYVNNDYTSTGDDIKEFNLEAGTYYYVVRSTNGRCSTYSLSVECEKINYTVVFDAMGGSIVTSSVIVEKGGSVTLPTPSKKYELIYNLNGGEGDDFTQSENAECIGWAKSSAASQGDYACGTSYTPNGDTTLFAVWGKALYTVSDYVPVREGYTFHGWSTDASAEAADYKGGDSYTAAGNSTLYAVWEKSDEDNSFSFFSIIEAIINFFVMIIDSITALLS